MYDRCRHIRVDGARCRAMAVTNKAFCYFHLHNRRKTAAKPATPNTADYGTVPVNPPAAQTALDLDLPLLEDRYAIQVGITRIARALTANEIDPKRAGLLLYALQIASSNLGGNSCLLPEDVRGVVLTTSGDEIAPATTIFEKEDLSGHKKNCCCDDCTYVQTDNEEHDADCNCGDCPSSATQGEQQITEEPAHPAEGTVSLQACADESSTTVQSQRYSERSAQRAVEEPAVSWQVLENGRCHPTRLTSRSSPGSTHRSGRHSKASAL
ncbi:MAG: hypothetical protein WA869_35685 [Alloacidobacterium sp.]